MPTINFLNPAFLWGLGLGSIPIIIHLLFRRQFKRIDWAPMRYLKLTIQRNRRRVQLEQLLLLLMRIAIISLLAFLVARPVIHSLGIAGWFGAGSRTSHVLVLDDSLSMDLAVDNRTVFDRAVELATHVIRDVGPQDRFTLVLASQPKQPLVHEVEVLDADQLAQLIRKQRPSAAFVSWGATMEAVDELLTSATYRTKEVTLLTDLRRAGWENNLKPLADRWVGDDVHLRIFDLGANSTHQLTLEELKAQDPCVLAGVPAHWEAVVRNSSDESLNHVAAVLLVDGKPNQLVLPPLPSGQSVHVPLTATFQEPGLHHLSLQLPADDLAADNQRWTVVDVRERLHVMLIDGQPSSEPLASETDFLGLALSLGGDDSASFQVEILTDADMAAVVHDQPDLLVLANVAAITPPQAARLRSLVEAGMGLMIFVGDQVDPDNYNQLLQGEGVELLPAQLESIVEQPVTGLVLESNSPSPLDALRQLKASVLEQVKTNKYYQLRLPGEAVPGVRVLARWNDADSSPAVVEKVVGRGRVLLWTTTANKSWTDWPTQPSYVLAMREGGKAVVRPTGAHDLTAGEAIRRPLPPDVQVTSPTIEIPDSDQPLPLAVDSSSSATVETSSKLSSGASLKPDEGETQTPAHSDVPTLAYSDTRRAGLYRLNWQTPPSGAGNDLFAVNPDARESDLTPITADELKNLWGELQPEIIAAGAPDADLTTRGEEIWRPLAMCLLGLMAVEACFATWVGRQR
ncbi:MAG TPA: BatA domain-containing protein [Pirellulales bacterium]|nr:BatA domain-containing protein [Pirellulales bacterium]